MLQLATGQRTEEVLPISDTGCGRPKTMLSWDKTKTGLAHSIPVPHQAVVVPDRLAPNSHGWFFPQRTNPVKCADHAGVLGVIKKFLSEHPAFVPFAARDIRRMWKALASDAGLSKEIGGRLQNHTRRDVSTRDYDRHGYSPERKAAMGKWAAYLDLVIAGTIDQLGALEGNVVPFGAATGTKS
jgi:hypothetical protein